MDNVTPTPQETPSKLPKFLTTVTPLSKFLAAVLFITLPFIGFYLGYKYQKLIILSDSSLERSVSPESISDNDLYGDLKKLRSEIIVYDSQPRIAAYLRLKEDPQDYHPFGQNSGSLYIYEDLVILNLDSGERKVYEFTSGFIPAQMLEFLNVVTPEGGAHYNLRPELLRWSPFTENVLWAKFRIHSNGDPPIANEAGLFRFDIKNSKIDNYAIPANGLFGEINENTNAEKVLYESFGDGLSLYLYDLKSDQNRLIVSYDKDIFDKYCSSEAEYVYKNTSFYGDCGRDRGLRAMWEEKGISYFDFITGKKVNLTIN